VYDNGSDVGTWSALQVASARGIATDGTGLWIVDRDTDKFFYFADAVAFTSGIRSATSSFDLDPRNGAPSGIASDGQFLWIVDSAEHQVFKYTATAGQLVGNWSLDAANVDPQGITNDPSGYGTTLWVVDATTDQVFAYSEGMNTVAGSLSFTAVYPLAAQNGAPRGLATPLPAYLLPPPSDGADVAPATTRLPQDVNNDGGVSALDALVIINHIGRVKMNEAEAEASNGQNYLDVNSDHQVTALDALQVINYLARHSDVLSNREGEAVVARALDSPNTNRLSSRATDAAFADLGSSTLTKLVAAGGAPSRATDDVTWIPTGRDSSEDENEVESGVGLLADAVFEQWN
jgi:hypothetical protein